MQTTKTSFSEKITGQVQNPFVELQQQFSENFQPEQTQAEIERLRLQHQRRIEAANQSKLKQELKRNQLIQQMNKLDTEIQYYDFPSEEN